MGLMEKNKICISELDIPDMDVFLKEEQVFFLMGFIYKKVGEI